MKPVLQILILLSLLAAPFARAGERIDPYVAEVPVAGQDAAAVAGARRAALAKVLVRATGDRNAASNTALMPLLADAERYVQQYRFLAAPQEEGGQLLWVRFDDRAVEPVLRAAAVSLWGELRPSVIAWVAVNDGSERYLMGGEAGGEPRRRMEQVAERRGLPVSFPLMDLEDQGRVRFADVWAGFREGTVEASRRYDADLILMGRLYRTAEGDWAGDWRVVIEGEERRWAGRGPQPEVLAEQALEELADRLAARYAMSGSAAVMGGDVALSVGGVVSLADFARVEHYMASLEGVSRAELVEAGKDFLRYRLFTEGGRAALEERIALGKLLVPDAGATAAEDGSLRYRLSR